MPIHVVAFATLYLGSFSLLERAYSQAGATAARFQLDQAVRNMPFLVQGGSSARNPHIFAHLLAAHQPIGLRLYRRDGSPLGAPNLSLDREEQAHVIGFLARGESSGESWVERDASSRQWVRGIVRITADTACTGCHQPGATLGVATMKLDFTTQLAEIRRVLRFRVGLLLAAWVTLIGGVTLIVQHTVRRSARKLESELKATSPGGESAPLPLDPVTAEVHRSLRELLARHRAREADVAHRLAHVDQLASLGQLAAGLAHEIKNPLAGIQGALEVLRDEAKGSEASPLYDEMLGELRRVHAILQRLLESGRPEPLRLVLTNPAKLIADTAEFLRPSLRRRRVELTTATAEDLLPAIQVDPAKIRQVLVNLVQNAAEAMGDEGGHVVIRASGFPAERAVVVAVEDDGPGIPAETLKRLFEPFYTTKFAGTGLGLAISKSIVEQHGGRIEVSSGPGRGTTFVLILPANPAEGPTDTAEPTVG